MWFLFFAIAMAALAIAAPHQNKRDYVVVVETETDIVWVTQVITVTADGLPAYTTSVSASLTSSVVSYTSLVATSAATSATGAFNHLVDPPSLSFLSYTVLSSPTWTSRAAPSTSVVVPPVYSSPVAATSIVVPPVYTSPVVIPPPVTTSVPPAPTTTIIPTTSNIPPVSTSIPVVPTSSAPSSTTQAVTSAPAASTPDSRPTNYSQLVLAHHNIHRRNHSAPDLVWDTGLANTAAKIAGSCKYAHDTDTDKSIIGGYGQNIAAGVPPSNVSAIITELFYNGEVNWYNALYSQSQPDMINFDHWGHFSQIVWHDTSKIGCATQQCSVLQNVPKNVPGFFTVCNYQSPGNVEGEYTEVGVPLGQPTIHWDYFN